MKKLKLATVIVLALILVLLIIQNTASVQAHFLGFTTEMSLVVLLFLTGALGFLAGLVLGIEKHITQIWVPSYTAKFSRVLRWPLAFLW